MQTLRNLLVERDIAFLNNAVEIGSLLTHIRESEGTDAMREYARNEGLSLRDITAYRTIARKSEVFFTGVREHGLHLPSRLYQIGNIASKYGRDGLEAALELWRELIS